MACPASRNADMLEVSYRTWIDVSIHDLPLEAHFCAASSVSMLTLTRRSLHLSQALSVVPS